MANKNQTGWGGDDGWQNENGPEEILEGWGNVNQNNDNKKKGTEWEHAGHVDNFVLVNDHSAQKGKGVCSSTSRGIPRNGPQGWKQKRDFNNVNDRGGWKEKRVYNNGNEGYDWKGKRVCNNGNEGYGWKGKRVCNSGNEGFGWKGKRALSNEIGGRSGKRASNNGNAGSQVSSGGNRIGRVQTLANSFHGHNGHRVSLHFPAHSPQLQKILSENFSLPGPALRFQGQVNDPHPRPRQVNGPVPVPPRTPPPVNAVQVYQRPVQNGVISRKVRVSHSTEGSWVMEVEEYR